jgi:pyruvate/2-oxoglutarate/acetoin dehydrogenase E1 component
MTTSTEGAIRSALDQALEQDPRVVLLGESVGRLGGAHRTSQGLQDRFGTERVIDLPLSENGAVGLAIGLALAGKRPVLELTAGGALPAREQIEGELARMALSEPEFPLPVTLRIATDTIGALQLADAESLALIPGLTVLAPSSPQDAAGMVLHGATVASGPTVVLESGWGRRSEVTLAPSTLGARVAREGAYCTVIAWGDAVETACQLDEDIEVVDLRVLAPLDIHTLTASIQKTGRVVVLGTGAFASSVLHAASQAAFLYLESPPALAAASELAGVVRASITY